MAAQLFTSSAERGNSDALFNLGIYHERGKGGMERNATLAEQCFRKSAEQGNLDAVFGLANILHKRGEEDEAMSLFKQASDQVLSLVELSLYPLRILLNYSLYLGSRTFES